MGLSVRQHVQGILGLSEIGTTRYGGLSAVAVRGTVLRAKEVQLCGARVKNVISLTINVFSANSRMILPLALLKYRLLLLIFLALYIMDAEVLDAILHG
jgi:hypothetical protein